MSSKINRLRVILPERLDFSSQANPIVVMLRLVFRLIQAEPAAFGQRQSINRDGLSSEDPGAGKTHPP
jgi:hypothetical protein